MEPRQNTEILVVVGLPATGKSYFARALGEKMQYPIVATDVVRKVEAGIGQADRPSDAGRTQRSAVSALGDRLGVPVHFYWLEATESVVEERLLQRKKENSGPSDLQDMNSWRLLRDSFEPLDDSEFPLGMLKKVCSAN